MTHNKRIVFLLVSIFIAGIGLGITLPVLPFYAERLMGTSKTLQNAMPIHVTGLTSTYALMQFLFGPFWGAQSDRLGRKNLICIGILGAAVSQVLFGLSNSLLLLYAARILGGVLSASLLPAATAYVADLSNDENRSSYMAWLGTVSSLATVAGLAFGGAISAADLHLKLLFFHLRIDGFSVPFFAAALLMTVTAIGAWFWLPESESQSTNAISPPSVSWLSLARALWPILILALAGQIALTAFEATFPLYAQVQFGYGAKEVGSVFMICGSVMAVFQVIVVTYASRRVSGAIQLSLGFAMMGVGIMLLSFAHQFSVILMLVAVLALGMAFIAPNLAALSAKDRGNHTGAAIGLLSGANSLGQVGGPLIGGILYAWRIEAPYAVGGLLMVVIAIATQAMRRKLSPVPKT